MFCRKISLPFLFALAFLVPAEGLVDSCSGQELLSYTKTMRGGVVTCESFGMFCVCTESIPKYTGEGAGQTEQDACSTALERLKEAINIVEGWARDRNKAQYYCADSDDNCCRFRDLCFGEASCPSLVFAAAVSNSRSAGCGKSEVKVLCCRCDNKKEIAITLRQIIPLLRPFACGVRCVSI